MYETVEVGQIAFVSVSGWSPIAVKVLALPAADDPKQLCTVEPHFGPCSNDFGRAHWRLPDAKSKPRTAEAAVEPSTKNYDGAPNARRLVERMLLDGVRLPE